MDAFACVHTRAQLLILFSCTYIPLAAIANKSGTVVKGHMKIAVDSGTYQSAFVVLDTTMFDKVGDFQNALWNCLDKTRARLTFGDCADDVVCRDFMRRNPHNAYPAPLPVSLPERVMAGSEGQTAGCDVSEGGEEGGG
jgi:hypothetical protein